MADEELHHWPADAPLPDGYEHDSDYGGHHSGRYRMIRATRDAGPRLVSIDDDGTPRAWFVRATEGRELSEGEVLQILRDTTDALSLMQKRR